MRSGSPRIWSAAFGLSLACASAWLAAGGLACAQASPASRQAREFHIEVNTLPGCFFSGCAQAISRRNVVVEVGGARVPVHIAQPPGSATSAHAQVPVHLLLVCAPGMRAPDDAERMRQLKRVLAAGWLISVSRGDGAFTPYAHEAALRRELAGPAAPEQDAGIDAIGQAIEELRTEPGYRVLLVDLGGKPDDKFERWISAAAGGLSPVYVSDGGEAQMSYSSSSTDARGMGLASPESAGSRKERAYSDGVFHEVNLTEALRDVFADRRYEYDLRFRAPAMGAAAGAQVKLTFLDPETHLPYELRTGLYSVEASQAGGKRLQVRVDASGRLLTVEK